MLSRVFLIKQGECCGNGCLMCPYEERHIWKSNKIRREIIKKLEIWEKDELKNIKIETHLY